MNPFSNKKRSGGHPLSHTGMLEAFDGESPSRIFMKEGKSTIENILKTIIPDKQKADAIASLIYKYTLFGLDDPKGPQMQYLNTLFATWAAVHGRASLLAFQSMVQVVSEQLTSQISGFMQKPSKESTIKTTASPEDSDITKHERR